VVLLHSNPSATRIHNKTNRLWLPGDTAWKKSSIHSGCKTRCWYHMFYIGLTAGAVAGHGAGGHWPRAACSPVHPRVAAGERRGARRSAQVRSAC
jgi:hypothetical protein